MKFLSIASVVAVALAASSASVSAQIPPVDASGALGINPMTGRSLSEEDLARQLSKFKLQTQIGQEMVKQAQNSADLALATLRQQAEKSRLVNESIAMGFAPGAGAGAAAGAGKNQSKPLTVIRPVAVAGQGAPAPKSQSGYGSELTPVALPPPAAVMPRVIASGVIRIGDETLEVTSAKQSQAVQVDWVDAQTKQTVRAGAPLQPISVQPATGSVGIPSMTGRLPPPFQQ